MGTWETECMDLYGRAKRFVAASKVHLRQGNNIMYRQWAGLAWIQDVKIFIIIINDAK